MSVGLTWLPPPLPLGLQASRPHRRPLQTAAPRTRLEWRAPHPTPAVVCPRQRRPPPRLRSDSANRKGGSAALPVSTREGAQRGWLPDPRRRGSHERRAWPGRPASQCFSPAHGRGDSAEWQHGACPGGSHRGDRRLTRSPVHRRPRAVLVCPRRWSRPTAAGSAPETAPEAQAAPTLCLDILDSLGSSSTLSQQRERLHHDGLNLQAITVAQFLLISSIRLLKTEVSN